MKRYSFTVIFEPAEEGGYTVIVPALPGCITEGDTLEEAQLRAQDAIRCYLESLAKDRQPPPQEKIERGEFITRLSVALD